MTAVQLDDDCVVAASGPRTYPHFSPPTTDDIVAIINKYAKHVVSIFDFAAGPIASLYLPANQRNNNYHYDTHEWYEVMSGGTGVG